MSICKIIDSLVRQKATGIYQFSGDKDMSYFEFAQNFADVHGYSHDLVKQDFFKGVLEFEPPKFTSMVNVY